MSDQIKNFLHGMGSVMDIYPDTSTFTSLVSNKNANERMRQAWGATGQQIRDAAGQFSNEQKQKKHSSR